MGTVGRFTLYIKMTKVEAKKATAVRTNKAKTIANIHMGTLKDEHIDFIS
jgi:hypothetical protein